MDFYRDTLGFDVQEEDVSYAPTVSRTHSVRCGPNTLWLDCVDNYSGPDLWLQLHTDDLGRGDGRTGWHRHPPV